MPRAKVNTYVAGINAPNNPRYNNRKTGGSAIDENSRQAISNPLIQKTGHKGKSKKKSKEYSNGKNEIKANRNS